MQFINNLYNREGMDLPLRSSKSIPIAEQIDNDETREMKMSNFIFGNDFSKINLNKIFSSPQENCFSSL